MAVWTEKELENALNVPVLFKINSGKIDFYSSDIEKGDIFIALKGARDGHDFVDDALSRGASAVIISKDIKSDKAIKVDDTAAALIKLATYKRVNSSAKFIGVTGSVGKTSTKEIIGKFLSNFDKTYFNKGSFNNHLGVPLSLASIPHDARYSVNEIGMNNAGEIRELTKLVKPHIAVITMIGEAHLENLGTIENICKAKCEIFEGLEENGTAIINIDSPYYDLQVSILKDLGVKNIYSFGESSKADCFLSKFEITDFGNIAHYNFFGSKFETINHLYGKHQSINIAASLLVVHCLGHKIESLKSVIESIIPYGGRGIAKDLIFGERKIKIIDDAYNANPTSVRAALESISRFTGTKVAILADMKELGERENEIHSELYKNVIDSGVTHFFGVGNLMKNLHDKLLGKIDSHHFNESSKENFEKIINLLPSGDLTILVKGSNSTKIRDFFDYFLNKTGGVK